VDITFAISLYSGSPSHRFRTDYAEHSDEDGGWIDNHHTGYERHRYWRQEELAKRSSMTVVVTSVVEVPTGVPDSGVSSDGGDLNRSDIIVVINGCFAVLAMLLAAIYVIERVLWPKRGRVNEAWWKAHIQVLDITE